MQDWQFTLFRPIRRPSVERLCGLQLSKNLVHQVIQSLTANRRDTQNLGFALVRQSSRNVFHQVSNFWHVDLVQRDDLRFLAQVRVEQFEFVVDLTKLFCRID